MKDRHLIAASKGSSLGQKSTTFSCHLSWMKLVDRGTGLIEACHKFPHEGWTVEASIVLLISLLLIDVAENNL